MPASVSGQRIVRLQQRGQRQAIGYFTGYTCKRQPVGAYELREAAKCFAFLHEKLSKAPTPAHQWSTVVNRILSDLDGRGTAHHRGGV